MISDFFRFNKLCLNSLLLLSLYCLSFNHANEAKASWTELDKQIKYQVFQLNVGLKLKMKNGLWIQLSDLSSKYHFPVFSTSSQDKGFRVVGFGSCFPVLTAKQDKTYFLTNRHVAQSGLAIAQECERFYAACALYAEQTSQNNDNQARYKELLETIDLADKKPLSASERALYQTTVDTIWDCYETYLSVKADPARALFKKYALAAGIQSYIGYFLHQAGPVTQPPIEASLYKSAESNSEPDLAIMTSTKSIPTLELDSTPACEGEEIQVIGYPTASDQIDLDSSQYYAPTFHTGRISRVAARLLQVDAPVTSGNSGGPVVNLDGKVLGVVAVRAVSANGVEMPNFGGAITVQSIKSFAPELFYIGQTNAHAF